MTPMERALLEALRPFAHNDHMGMGYRSRGLEPPTESDRVRARELIERFDGQSETEYRRLAPTVGADPDWYGKTFKDRTKLLTVNGINPNASKNVMSLRDQHGKIFKCSIKFVRDGLPKPAPAPRTRTRSSVPGQRLLDMGPVA